MGVNNNHLQIEQTFLGRVSIFDQPWGSTTLMLPQAFLWEFSETYTKQYSQHLINIVITSHFSNTFSIPMNTGLKLNLHKTFKRGSHKNILFRKGNLNINIYFTSLIWIYVVSVKKKKKRRKEKLLFVWVFSTYRTKYFQWGVEIPFWFLISDS